MIGDWLGVPEIGPCVVWRSLPVITGHFSLVYEERDCDLTGDDYCLGSGNPSDYYAPLIITCCSAATFPLFNRSGDRSALSCLLLFPGETNLFLYAVLACALAISRHRANIQRIMNGTENKILRKKAKEDHK